MVKIRDKIHAEMGYIEITLAELEKTNRGKRKNLAIMAGMGAFIQNVYNGMENILKQLSAHEGASVSKTARWHKDLLDDSVKRGYISKKTADDIGKLMYFRHFFTHSYGFLLEEGKLGPLVKSAPATYARFKKDVEKYLKNTDKKNK